MLKPHVYNSHGRIPPLHLQIITVNMLARRNTTIGRPQKGISLVILEVIRAHTHLLLAQPIWDRGHYKPSPFKPQHSHWTLGHGPNVHILRRSWARV